LLALLELLDLQPIAEATDGIVRLIDAVSVRTQAAEFTWGGRIVLNDLNAAVGDEKIGKGVLLIWLIAQLTTGRMTGEPVTVVYASTEENLERIVKPRLMAAGAVLERVRFLPMGPVGLPEALPELTRAMVDAGASFLFLDPINEHFSQGLDPNKAKDVAAVLGKLAIAATEYGITLIGSLHTNRSGGLTSRERLAHQIQFRRSLRSGLLIGRTDDDEDGDRTIVHDFSNYAETAPALKARIHGEVVETDDGRLATYPVLTVGDETDATAEDIFLKDADREGAISKAKDERGRRGQVAQNILGRWRSLGHPSEVLASEMTLVTKDVPAGTLSRARASLGIETVADRDPATGQVRGHVWLFPPALLER
jgi:hypothetical protein